jgi:hypothetical protein
VCLPDVLAALLDDEQLRSLIELLIDESSAVGPVFLAQLPGVVLSGHSRSSVPTRSSGSPVDIRSLLSSQSRLTSWAIWADEAP